MNCNFGTRSVRCARACSGYHREPRQAAGRSQPASLEPRPLAGTGTFGRVRLVEADALRKHLGSKDMDHPANCFFALKIMKKSEVVRLKQVEHIKNEKEILTEVNHPFIVVLCAAATPSVCCCQPREFRSGRDAAATRAQPRATLALSLIHI